MKRVVSSVAVVTLGAAALAVASSTAATRVWQPAYDSGALRVAHPLTKAQAEANNRLEDPAEPCRSEALSAYIGDNGQCRQSHLRGQPDVVLLGDSHAEHLFPGVVEALPGQNVAVMSFRAPYMFGNREGLDIALEAILSGNARPTVLISRAWTRGHLAITDQLEPLDYAVDRLTAGGSQVILLDDVPQFPFPVLACSDRLAPIISTSVCDQPLERVEASRDEYLADLRAVAASHPNARVVEMGKALCDETTCSMLSGDEVAYFDRDHLNTVGSRVFGAELVEAAGLEDVVGR